MKIKSLQLKNFKRFTDLTIQDIPENARLVLLIGSNGSGKSSVFDGFEIASDLLRKHIFHRTGLSKSNFAGGKNHKAKNLHQSGLVDRDYLSNEEIEELKETYPFLYVLPFYCFENLLYHPDNLEEYYQTIAKPFDKAGYLTMLIDAKNEAKDNLLPGIVNARNSYPFYKENEHEKKLKAFRANSRSPVDLLRSDELNEFYKIFPMKDYATQLNERQNISKTALAKTNWFNKQIEAALQ